MVKVVKNVVCPFCGTLCDDIEVLVEDGHIVGTRNACRIGNAKFMHYEGSVRYDSPLMRENKKDEFKKVDYETAIEETARLLVESKLPLIYGWSSAECHAQQLGVLLGEKVNGVLDNTASV
ncbi:formylmethanofuran dehydrogenase subunit B [Methanococcus voltae]|uniref:Formylmethanofuran dehydrogenase subunit B n=2 Tax=Methanococcus voltae TaxID=2188 RepID=A0A8J7RCH3_METVO|nr:formylmethanofuran dehydrogenase subunit B [Methanococcus voltae]MBP2172342.1 formylmethanofuran dehydrogenase subunit B [Methanococcus voltae]MBP2200702.1 formylmethanofuran dehydrogenase subunit B [Methanococcus voltae]